MRFEPGDRALLVDSKGRNYLITLQAGRSFHFHRGIVTHDQILAGYDGMTVTSTGGERLAVLRPTYADFVLKMPRGAQVIYPKDVAMILMHGDIYPGAFVLEAGVGSGALCMALVRAVGPEGRVVSYEIREDFAQKARENVEALLGKADNLEIRMGSVYEPIELIDGRQFDRVVLDLPEPWNVLPALRSALRPGGVFVSYLPTTIQVHQLVAELEADKGWTSVGMFETLVRTWHVEARSMRPDHRMVAHTGFITVARSLERDAPQAPEVRD